jgi:hypothetical protein
MARIDVQPGPELVAAIRAGEGKTADTAHKALTALPETPEPPRPLGAAAFHGLAGELMVEIEPHTEAAAAALLVQFLAAVGNAAGRGPGFQVEADRHHTNLYVAIVGDTASARKGSSWGQAKRLVEAADPSWGERIATGASSGEGLIFQVRDPIEDTRKAKDGEDSEDGFVTELADLGVDDKRLLLIEPELASVLERMQRDGNTLSAVLRQAWDGGKLDTLVKTNRATSTGAHVSLIGHVTIEELRRKLTATEQANGFANRILWVYARRSKSLPFGGNLDAVDWEPYVERLRAALRYGSVTGVLDMDGEARQLWIEHYPRLSTGRDGLLGAVTARGPAQVRRLAVIYALLDPLPDGSPIVTAPHLRAALEVWRYCSDSAAYIFGAALGDETADAILAELRRAGAEGRTRNELRNLFGRHRSAQDLDRAIARLSEGKLIHGLSEATAGRPRTRYYAGAASS